MIDSRICIVGLGLMGGSLAKALFGQVETLIGVDQHAATRQVVLAQGDLDFVTGNLQVGLAAADLIILATPVRSILQILGDLPTLLPKGCQVMDLGSTKQAIGAAMAALPPTFSAIGGHPMCGKEKAGFAAADSDLFRNQNFVLCPNERTTPALEKTADAVVKAVGANPLILSAEAHDNIVAMTSHLPYLISAMLMHQVSAMADDRVWSVSASGFRDTSRLAGSDPQMMLDILLTNKEAVLSQLQRYRGELDSLAVFLEDEDEEKIASWLEESQRQHMNYRKAKSS
jgi:prephenate dehydrogenase